MMILDMKLRVLLTIAILMLFCSYSIGQQKICYAVYTEEDKTITCYNDELMDSRTGTEILELDDVDGRNGGIDCFQYEVKKVVERVKFDPSFASAQFRHISYWFASMEKLTAIEGLQYFDTSEVTTAKSAFQGCSSLNILDLRSLSMPKLKNASGMFKNCGAKIIRLFQNGNKITNMEMMFTQCTNLESINFLDHLDTYSVTTMKDMFYLCSSLKTLDLSTWNTGKVENMSDMFNGCSSLTTIYGGARWSLNSVNKSGTMFHNCTQLTGNEGTTYNVYKTDCTYARIDGGPSNPGYFSAKSADLWVGGNKVTSDNCTSLPVESGSASYDFRTKTLMLNNATISVTAQGDYCIANGLSAEQRVEGIDGLTIQVNGDCRLNASNIAMMINGNTTLTGTGKLSVDGMTAVWIEEGKNLTVGLDHFYATASEEVIDGFYGGLSIDGTKIKSFVCEPKSTGWHYNTINGLFMDMNDCHFADPEGPWQYGEVERFNNWDGIYLRYGLGQYRGKVVIEPDSEPLRYRLWVGGTRVTSKNKNAIGVASGTASYDPATHTLTLNNANIVAGGYDDGISNGLANIEGMADFKIVCKGENNSIDAMESDGSGMALYGNTTITGSPLCISAYNTNNKGIFAGKDVILTLKDADVYIEAASPVYSQNGVVYVNHSRLEALPTSSNERVSAVSDAKAFNMTNCAFADQGDGTDPAYLYYDSDEQMREICLSGAPYHGRIVIVPTGYAISTDINAIDNGQLTIDSSLPLYNLHGQRVSHPVKGQIYIQNGRKIKF